MGSALASLGSAADFKSSQSSPLLNGLAKVRFHPLSKGESCATTRPFSRLSFELYVGGHSREQVFGLREETSGLLAPDPPCNNYLVPTEWRLADFPAANRSVR
jgi:hypothetical protein